MRYVLNIKFQIEVLLAKTFRFWEITLRWITERIASIQSRVTNGPPTRWAVASYLGPELSA